MMLAKLNPFQTAWAAGFKKLTPVIPPGVEISPKSYHYARVDTPGDSRGKAPGVRGSDGKWSGLRDWQVHETTEADLELWGEMGASVGIRLGRQHDGRFLVMIDADTTDKACAKIIHDLIREHLGVLPIRIGRYPKAGYFVCVDADLHYSRLRFTPAGERAHHVEILGENKQAVGDGVHPATKQPYRWPGGFPLYADIPTVAAAALTALLEALKRALPDAAEISVQGAGDAPKDQRVLTGPLDLVRRAVEATPNTDEIFPKRDDYVAYGYAIKAALPDHPTEALGLYLDWCARWTTDRTDEFATNTPAVAEAEWRRMHGPFKRGASWLYELADQWSDGAFEKASMWLDDGATVPADSLFGNGDNAFLERAAKLAFTGFGEAADTALTASAAPLVKGLLDQGAMTVMYGPSNVGKTFVAMDIGHAIATGRAWGGMKVARRMVVYVAAEGGAGARKRVAALRKVYGADADGWFWLLLSPVNLLRADADLKPLILAIRALIERAPADARENGVGLLVIDTLSRAMAGGDENASTDMGAMVTHLDVLRKALACHVMAAHHSGKDAARGARGHSLLRAATDTEIEIEDGGQFTVTKQRDLDKAFTASFALEPVTLGTDGEGDAVGSCVIRLTAGAKDATREAVGTPTNREARVLDALDALEGLDADGGRGVSVASLVDYFATREEPLSKQNIKKIVSRLSAKNMIETTARGRYARDTKYDCHLWVEKGKGDNGVLYPSDGKGQKVTKSVFE